MRTAEAIIREYLERGHSVESLRVLADSRSEPLRTEMLTILERYRQPVVEERDALIDDISVESDNMVFFVADDTESSAEGDNVDFDVMASVPADGPSAASQESVAEIMVDETDTTLAVREESVAEIVVGETEGSDVVDAAAPEEASPIEAFTVDAETDEPGIWSRYWRPEEAEDMSEPRLDSVRGGEESATEDVALGTAGAAVEEAVEATSSVDSVRDADVAAADAGENETPCADEPVDAAETIDYIPGSVDAAAEAPRDEGVRDPARDMRLLLEAQAALIRSMGGQPPILSDAERKDKDSTSVIFTGETALAEQGDHAAAPAPSESQRLSLSRKERRRRERAEKRKKKSEVKTSDTSGVKARKDALPEIVLAKSEGTETLVPETRAGAESDGPTAQAVESAAADAAPSLLAAAVAESDDGDGSVEAAVGGPLMLEHFPAKEADAGEDTQAIAAESRDHLMIIANGGLDLRERDADADAVSPLFGAGPDADAAEEEEMASNNVILFRPSFSACDESVEEEAADEEPAGLCLRVVHTEEAEAAEPAAQQEQPEEPAQAEPAAIAEAPAPAAVPLAAAEQGGAPGGGEVVSPEMRRCLLRAVSGAGADGEEVVLAEAPHAAADDHVIVSMTEEVDENARIEAMRVALAEEAAQASLELEKEYQARLDEFARRLLEVQSAASDGESRLRDKNAELAVREKDMAELRNRLMDKDAQLAALAADLEKAAAEAASRNDQLRGFAGLHDEHLRLYNEFEDLRKGYNEMVSAVLPDLQKERDDLVLTLDNQCLESEGMRASLKSARRRVTVGYALSAAACLVMLALPVVNWLRTGDDIRNLAMAHQETTELRERLEQAQRAKDIDKQTIFDLNRDMALARGEVSQLKTEKTRLEGSVKKLDVELASLKGAGPKVGTPTRGAAMALSGPNGAGGELRVNEVRDPAGSIEQLAQNNRQRNGTDNFRPPQEQTRPGTVVPVMAVADGRGRAGAAVQAPRAEAIQVGDMLATVKAGEGVAQVVYRVLGTRDPEIIDWVIRENNIKADRRGNPRIYPEQQLKLPQGGRMVQSASAAHR